MKKIKGFKTYKCGRCNNVMRSEYMSGVNHRHKRMSETLMFVASDEDKRIAEQICHELIDSLSLYQVGFKAYVMQMLLEGFEATYQIDLRHGISVKQEKYKTKEMKT